MSPDELLEYERNHKLISDGVERVKQALLEYQDERLVKLQEAAAPFVEFANLFQKVRIDLLRPGIDPMTPMLVVHGDKQSAILLWSHFVDLIFAAEKFDGYNPQSN